MATEGVILSSGFLRSLSISYQRSAEDIIKRYNDDAIINGLEFDRHEETRAVETFRRALEIAGRNFVDDNLGTPLIPNWNRVTSALPDFLEKLFYSVEEDNKEIRGALSN